MLPKLELVKNSTIFSTKATAYLEKKASEASWEAIWDASNMGSEQYFSLSHADDTKRKFDDAILIDFFNIKNKNDVIRMLVSVNQHDSVTSGFTSNNGKTQTIKPLIYLKSWFRDTCNGVKDEKKN